MKVWLCSLCLQVSEKMGLLHVSKGQEPDRYIEIRKYAHERDRAKKSNAEPSILPEAALGLEECQIQDEIQEECLIQSDQESKESEDGETDSEVEKAVKEIDHATSSELHKLSLCIVSPLLV